MERLSRSDRCQGRAAIGRMRECYQGTRNVPPSMTADDTKRVARFRQHLIDIRDYLRNNGNDLTDYGKARRDGLRISSAPAESGMNNMINQRMGKRQPCAGPRMERMPYCRSAAPCSTIGWKHFSASGSQNSALPQRGLQRLLPNGRHPQTCSTSKCGTDSMLDSN